MIKTQIKESFCEEFEKDILFNVDDYKWGELYFVSDLQRFNIDVKNIETFQNGLKRERTSFMLRIFKHKRFIFKLTPEQKLDNKLYNYFQLHLQEKEKRDYLRKNKELLDMMPEDKRIKLMRELKLNRITK